MHNQINCQPPWEYAIPVSGRAAAMVLVLVLLFTVSGHCQPDFNLEGNAALAGTDRYRLTSATTSQTGAIWHPRKINLTESFDVQLYMNFGNLDVDGADGIVFILQPVSTSIGAMGGDIGYGGVKPSLGVEFDTYRNPEKNDPFNDHIAIEKNGDVDHQSANRLAGPVDALQTGGNIEDGSDHRVRITWNATDKEMKVYFDCMLRLTYKADIVKEIFNNSPYVFWGFSSATGNAVNNHTVTLLYTTLIPDNRDTIICKGRSVQLHAAGGGRYEWTPTTGLDNPRSASPIATPAQSTLYTVKVTDICGDVWEKSTWIGVNDPAALNLGPDRKVCRGETVKLKAGELGGEYLWSDGSTSHLLDVRKSGTYWVKVGSGECVKYDSVTLTFDGPVISLGEDKLLCPGQTAQLDAGDGFLNYRWQDGSSGRYFTVTKAGTYWVRVKTAECETADTITVKYGNPVVNLGPDKILCPGYTEKLYAGFGFQTYLWQDGSTDKYFSATKSGKYWVRVGIGSCYATDTIELFFRHVPAPELGEDRKICGQQPILLDAGAGYDTYLWQDNSRNRYHLADQTGKYWVEVARYGCKTSDTVNISLHEMPKAVLGPDTAVCLRDGLKLDVGPLFAEVQWQDGSNAKVRTVRKAGTYKFKGTTVNGCTAEDSIVVSGIESPPVFIPSAFSPNTDGTNDKFLIPSLSGTDFELVIYNRWGEVVYHYDNEEQGPWDGRFKGARVPEGNYFYMLRVRDCSNTENYYRGSIAVVR